MLWSSVYLSTASAKAGSARNTAFAEDNGSGTLRLRRPVNATVFRCKGVRGEMLPRP
jgi:hypothetical protein